MVIDIYKNKFVRKIIKNGREIFKKDPIIKKDLINFRKGIQSRKHKNDPYFKYNSNVAFDVFRILETLDDLRNVQIFLRQYPYPKTLKKNKISRTSYAIYHIEVYYLKVASLRDKLAVLINDVYQVGLPDRRATIELLSEMKQLKGVKCITLLKKFSNAIDGIIKQKNFIAHRGKYDDRELSEIRFYEPIQNEIQKLEPIIKLKTRLYISKKLRLFRQNQKSIEKFIDTFLSCFTNEFNKRCKILSKKQLV